MSVDKWVQELLGVCMLIQVVDNYGGNSNDSESHLMLNILIISCHEYFFLYNEKNLSSQIVII